MDFTTYVKPELAVLIPALYGLGLVLKNMKKISDNFIPAILTVVAMALACFYVLGTEGVTFTSIVTGVVQGILCAAGAVYTNQLYKQSTK